MSKKSIVLALLLLLGVPASKVLANGAGWKTGAVLGGIGSAVSTGFLVKDLLEIRRIKGELLDDDLFSEFSAEDRLAREDRLSYLKKRAIILGGVSVAGLGLTGICAYKWYNLPPVSKLPVLPNGQEVQEALIIPEPDRNLNIALILNDYQKKMADKLAYVQYAINEGIEPTAIGILENLNNLVIAHQNNDEERIKARNGTLNFQQAIGFEPGIPGDNDADFLQQIDQIDADLLLYANFLRAYRQRGDAAIREDGGVFPNGLVYRVRRKILLEARDSQVGENAIIPIVNH